MQAYQQKDTVIRGANAYVSRIFIIPSIKKGNLSEEIPLKIGNQGSITAVKSRCSSNKYSIFFTERKGSSTDKDFVYAKQDIDKELGFDMGETSFNEYNFNFLNKDQPQEGDLYLTIKNDGTVDTGLITITLTIAE